MKNIQLTSLQKRLFQTAFVLSGIWVFLIGVAISHQTPQTIPAKDLRSDLRKEAIDNTSVVVVGDWKGADVRTVVNQLPNETWKNLEIFYGKTRLTPDNFPQHVIVHQSISAGKPWKYAKHPLRLTVIPVDSDQNHK